ncbi:hypothetical protein X975_26397, partial [Stegodyphus mimosarum]
MPCRHECLCVKCMHMYLKYDKKCPICRKDSDCFLRLP